MLVARGGGRRGWGLGIGGLKRDCWVLGSFEWEGGRGSGA